MLLAGIGGANRLDRVGGAGRKLVEGTVDEPSTVTVNGDPAPLRPLPGGASFLYSKELNLGPGEKRLEVEATDPNGNVARRSYTVSGGGLNEITGLPLDVDINGGVSSASGSIAIPETAGTDTTILDVLIYGDMNGGVISFGAGEGTAGYITNKDVHSINDACEDLRRLQDSLGMPNCVYHFNDFININFSGVSNQTFVKASTQIKAIGFGLLLGLIDGQVSSNLFYPLYLWFGIILAGGFRNLNPIPSPKSEAEGGRWEHFKKEELMEKLIALFVYNFVWIAVAKIRDL